MLHIKVSLWLSVAIFTIFSILLVINPNSLFLCPIIVSGFLIFLSQRVSFDEIIKLENKQLLTLEELNKKIDENYTNLNIKIGEVKDKQVAMLISKGLNR